MIWPGFVIENNGGKSVEASWIYGPRKDVMKGGSECSVGGPVGVN